MSIKWITEFWDDSPYDGTKLLLLLALADTSSHDGRFFASQTDLAKKGRCSVEYVRKVINEMIEDGYLKIITKGSSRGKATIYQLLHKEPPNSVGGSESEPPNSDPSNSPTLTPQLPNSTPYHPSYTSVLSTTNEASPLFRFLQIYPRRDGGTLKPSKALVKALANTPIEVILEGAKRYRDDPGRDPAYTKMAATWLNNECWNDPALPARPQQGVKFTGATQLPPRLKQSDLPSGGVPMPASVRDVALGVRTRARGASDELGIEI